MAAGAYYQDQRYVLGPVAVNQYFSYAVDPSERFVMRDRATERGTVGFIVAMLDKGVDPAQVAGKVDELFGIMRFFAYPVLLW